MLKRIIILIFTSLLFTFISCPHDCTPEEYKKPGKYIDNLPEWTKDALVSEWKPWNTGIVNISSVPKHPKFI